MKSESAALLRNYFLQAGISAMWLLQEAFHMWTIDHRVSPFIVSTLAAHACDTSATWCFCDSEHFCNMAFTTKVAKLSQRTRQYLRQLLPAIWARQSKALAEDAMKIYKGNESTLSKILKKLHLKAGASNKTQNTSCWRAWDITLALLSRGPDQHFFLTISMYTSTNIGCKEGRFVNSQVDLIRAGKEEV